MGLVCLLGAIAALAGVPPSSGRADLQSRLSATQAREGAVKAGISAHAGMLSGLEGRLSDVRAHLDAIGQVLRFEREQLASLQGELRDARAHQVLLQSRLDQGRRLLATQLVASYESDRPDAVTVVINARGFADLLERADQLKRIQQANVHTINAVAAERIALQAEAQRLAKLEARQQRLTTAELYQRDEVLRLQSALVAKAAPYRRAQARRQAKLDSLRARERALSRQLSALAPASSLGGAVAPSSIGGFSSHGGAYGFFPAAGTDYGPGDEPQLAARLDALGKALGLHLIGISGYRSPGHSISVGGFANDPHTRGQASDTPGVEAVPEATLNRFGLTRPFPGPAEADHIQLAGSPL